MSVFHSVPPRSRGKMERWNSPDIGAYPRRQAFAL